MNNRFVLPTEVANIIKLLNENGHNAYIVGGCVRDQLMNRLPHDYDICTSALPSDVLSIFQNYSVIETGLKHGTVTVVINNESYEITTFREDGNYSDNRRPDTVTFVSNIYADLSRRDFTINAMAYDECGLIDPFNGYNSIMAKEINCVGNAHDRFKEDALRILRAMRFAVQLQFDITPSTGVAMHCQRELIKNISAERINSEIIKMLMSGNPITKVWLTYADIVAVFIPEMELCFDFQQNNSHHIYDVYTHILYAVDAYKGSDLVVKLTLLFHDIGKPMCYSENENGGHFYAHGVVGATITQSILKRLRFDNKTIADVIELVQYHNDDIEVNHKTVKKWLNKIGEQQFRRLLDVRTADMLAHSVVNREIKTEALLQLNLILDEVLSEQQCFTIQQLCITGKDLISIGYNEGKALGAALRGLVDCVIADEVKNEKEELLKLAKGWIEQ